MPVVSLSMELGALSKEVADELALAAGMRAAVRKADPIVNRGVSLVSRGGVVDLRGIVRTRRQFAKLHAVVNAYPGVRCCRSSVKAMSDDARCAGGFVLD